MSLSIDCKHIDGEEKKLTESLLENGFKAEIVKDPIKPEKEFSPLFRQVSGLSSIRF